MRILTTLLLLVALDLQASGQIICAIPKDERVEKRYRKYLTTFKGMQVVIGEPKLGLTCTKNGINKIGGSEAKNEMYVADPADPSFVPYKWEDGRRVKNGKRSVCVFSGDDFPTMQYVDRLQTLEGLALEYQQRRKEIEQLTGERDGYERGDAAWFGFHAKLLARLDRLRTWLINMGYPAATKKLSRELGQQKQAVSREATALREKKALDSVQKAETPERLKAVADTIGGGRHRFFVRESQHIRMVYLDQLSNSEAERGLVLGEEIIEAFRKDFVDPYRDEDYHDYIPDTLFAEFFFCPPDDSSYERYRTEYYGSALAKDKHADERKQMAGSNFRGGSGGRGGGSSASYVSYFRLKEQRDIEGIVAHRMGHILASLHYNRGNANDVQVWLGEAVGYYVSLGHLGRNTLTCFQWSEPTYAQPEQKAVEKTVQLGLRGYFNELALSDGPAIDALAIKQLWQIGDADFAKAWSFYDFVAMRLGRDGQNWLRNTCFAAGSSRQSDFMRRWRTFSEQLFPVQTGTDVFAEIDRKWREYAEDGQRQD